MFLGVDAKNVRLQMLYIRKRICGPGGLKSKQKNPNETRKAP